MVESSRKILQLDVVHSSLKQTSSLNKHLSDYMPGLTAKVFRTYNASFTFERELEKNMKELVKPTLAEKIYVYNKANREVAVLCNHQKSVSKGHDASMEKAYDKIKAMKYQRRRLRYQLLKANDYNKKEHKKFNQDESDLDDEWMGNHEIDLGVKEQEKVTKSEYLTTRYQPSPRHRRHRRPVDCDVYIHVFLYFRI
jgi:DNA topoisomerase-1